MIKKLFLLSCLIFLFTSASGQKGSPFYYELISNPSKTIDFDFGFYPASYKYVESEGIDPYTSFKCAIINNSKNSLNWTNYKINIMLKSGKLIRSYTTVATSGDYNCNFDVDAGTTHYQYYCFHEKFTDSDIEKVWLVLGDDQIFNLVYDNNEK